MIAFNLIQQTNYVKDGAPTVVPQAILALDLSPNQLQKDAVQPQARTAHEYGDSNSPERTVKPQADAVPAKEGDLATQQLGELSFYNNTKKILDD